MLRTLVLSFTYEPMYFKSDRRVLKLLANEKVEVLSTWDNHYFQWSSGKIAYPATVRFTFNHKHFAKKPKFHRKLILKRDMYRCAYCNYAGTPNNMTIDHIIPRCQGGKNTFENCVAACKACNGYKNDKTPEQAKMTLLYPPRKPDSVLITEYQVMKYQHPDWEFYLRNL